MFVVFKALLERLNKFPDQPELSTGELVGELRKSGFNTPNEETVKSAITNLRTHKIEPAKLKGYISIIRNKEGSKLVISQQTQTL